MEIEVKTRHDTPNFRKWILQFITTMVNDFPGIALREQNKYSDFVNVELQWADCVILWKRDEKICGFVMLNSRHERFHKLILMCSKEKGLGTIMMEYVKNMKTTHVYIILRSVLESAMFYKKIGCKVFNFLECDTYITGKYDTEISNMNDAKEMHKHLKEKNWLPLDQDEDDCNSFIPFIALTTYGECLSQKRPKTFSPI